MALSGHCRLGDPVIRPLCHVRYDVHARLNVARGIPITGVHGRQTDVVAMESLALQGPVKGEVL